MLQKALKQLRNFFRWLFSAPFRELPPEFGDPVPSDLRAFEAEAEEIQHHSRKDIPPPSSAAPKNIKRGR